MLLECILRHVALDILVKENGYTCGEGGGGEGGRATLKLFCLPSDKGSTIKGRNFAFSGSKF